MIIKAKATGLLLMASIFCFSAKCSFAQYERDSGDDRERHEWRERHEREERHEGEERGERYERHERAERIAPVVVPQRRHARGPIFIFNETRRPISITINDDHGRLIGRWVLGRGEDRYLTGGGGRIKVDGDYRISANGGMPEIEDIGRFVDGHWAVSFGRRH